MNAPQCSSVRELFSGYLDGAVSGREMQVVAAHLQSCEPCHTEFAAWRDVQSALASVGPAKVPAELGLRLRLAISHENARRQGHWYDWLSIHWENLVRPALLQLSAGLVGAVALVGSLVLLLGVVATPKSVLANDEPLGALSSPHFLYSAARLEPVVTGADSTIVIQAKSTPQARSTTTPSCPARRMLRRIAQVRNQLLLEVYEPARVFGVPVSGQVLITFSGVSVRA